MIAPLDGLYLNPVSVLIVSLPVAESTNDINIFASVELVAVRATVVEVADTDASWNEIVPSPSVINTWFVEPSADGN